MVPFLFVFGFLALKKRKKDQTVRGCPFCGRCVTAVWFFLFGGVLGGLAQNAWVPRSDEESMIELKKLYSLRTVAWPALFEATLGVCHKKVAVFEVLEFI